MAAYQTVTVTWYRTKGVGQQQTQRLPNAAWSHWQMSVWCVRTEAKVALRDYWGSKFTCSDGAAVPTPTSPAHSGRIRALIKATSAPAGDVSQSHRGAGGLFLLLQQSFGEYVTFPKSTLGKGRDIFHTQAQSHGALVCDSRTQRKSSWVITIITSIILLSRQLLQTRAPRPISAPVKNRITLRDETISPFNQPGPWVLSALIVAYNWSQRSLVL